MKYAVIYEKSRSGYSCYCPDLPGCIAAATTLPETETLMVEAIEMHLAGMREDGEAIPEPTTQVGYADVA
jgi:predicted RNase H-like HicB family nuclease